jgi:hypothetical protein
VELPPILHPLNQNHYMQLGASKDFPETYEKVHITLQKNESKSLKGSSLYNIQQVNPKK